VIYFESQVQSIVQAKDETISDLRERVKILQAMVESERKRAEKAIDALLLNNGVAPVSPKEPKSEAKASSAAAFDYLAATSRVGV